MAFAVQIVNLARAQSGIRAESSGPRDGVQCWTATWPPPIALARAISEVRAAAVQAP